MAEFLGLALPQACEAGVSINFHLLLGHARIVAKADEPELDPAEIFYP